MAVDERFNREVRDLIKDHLKVELSLEDIAAGPVIQTVLRTTLKWDQETVDTGTIVIAEKPVTP